MPFEAYFVAFVTMQFEAYAFYRVVAYRAEMADFGFVCGGENHRRNVTHGSCDVCFMVVVWV